MFKENTQQTQPTEKKNKPTHKAMIRSGRGKSAIYEQIGVGWYNEEKKSLFVKLHGHQFICDDFTLYKIK